MYELHFDDTLRIFTTPSIQIFAYTLIYLLSKPTCMQFVHSKLKYVMFQSYV